MNNLFSLMGTLVYIIIPIYFKCNYFLLDPTIMITTEANMIADIN